MPRFIECCTTSAFEVSQALQGGASRAELCERLEVGGVTPSLLNIQEALKLGLPVNVLIRSREGDFVYSESEVDEMVESIRMCRTLGVNAVVIGALDSHGNVDKRSMSRMLQAAGDMPVTFHRAFDETSDPFAALEDIIALGCKRLLTSGHSENALSGADMLAKLVKQAAGRIIIMPGKGVRPENIAQIERISGAMEFHSSAHGVDGRTDRYVVSELVHNPVQILAQ